MEKKQRLQKQYSLKTHILGAALAAYFLILLLLIVMTFIAIFDYRAQDMSRMSGRYEKLLEGIEERISELDEYMVDLYLNNFNVHILQADNQQLDKFMAEEALNNQLLAQMRLDRHMAGFYFCYDNSERYSFNMQTNQEYSRSNSESRRRLYEYFHTYMSTAETGLHRQIFELDGNIYYQVLNKGVNVGVIGLELIGSSSDNVKDEKGRQTAVFVEYNDALLGADNGFLSLGVDKREETAFRHQLSAVPENQGVYMQTEAQGFYVYKQYSNAYGYCLYQLVEYSLAGFFGMYQIILVLLIPFSALLFVYIYRKLRKFMIRPLYEMSEAMNEIRNGNWEVRLGQNGHYEEIDQMGRTLELLLSEIERLKIQSYEEKLDAQRTQLQYMQLQLKPHFYLNCMKMLNALLSKKDYDRMKNLIFSVSGHLRYLLCQKEMLVTLKEELDFVKNYLEMQRNLASHEIRYELDIEPGMMAWQVPMLCLQVFVENSVKYAGVPEDGVLKIHISIVQLHMEGEWFLDIVIRDNGNGYPKEVLALLNSRDSVENEKLGVGITNLKKRFSLLYEKQTEYEFHNEHGAVSELIVPKKEETMDEAVNRG